MTYELVKGDQFPQIQATLTRQDDGSAVDLRGGGSKLRFRAKGTTTVLFTLDSFISQDNFQIGKVIFSFTGTNLNLAEGFYEGEISIQYNGGTTETIYDVLDFYVRDDFRD